MDNPPRNWIHGLVLTAALAGCGRNEVQITNPKGQPIPAAEVRPIDVEKFVAVQVKAASNRAYELRETMPTDERTYGGFIAALTAANDELTRSRHKPKKLLTYIIRAADMADKLAGPGSASNPALDHFRQQVVVPLQEARNAQRALVDRQLPSR